MLVVQWHAFATRHRTTPLAAVYHARPRVLPGCVAPLIGSDDSYT
ncbi:MAG: hypothetical protein OJF49_001340 [Ktedonobacterales bacterium]|nr:MAG: hypothetical protein OJF49_001340 [Ktedonobacterales bacterium]